MVVQTKVTQKKQSPSINRKQPAPASTSHADADVSVDVNKMNDPNHLLYLQRTIFLVAQCFKLSYIIVTSFK